MGQFIDFAYVKKHAYFPHVLTHYGIKYKSGSDNELRCHCPFHDDESPSFSVNTEKNVFKCHAASCGETGNILEFVAKMEEVDLRIAAEMLANYCNIALAPPKSVKPGKGKKLKKVEKKAKTKAEKQPVAESVEVAELKPLGFTLNLDPSHEYAADRGLDFSTINRFEMGYCNRGMMKGRWCVPIYDTEGELVAYIGRWAGVKRPKDEPKYKLPPKFDKSKVLFNLHRVLTRKVRSVVVVEGVFDVIRLHNQGVPAVALLGSSLSDEQLRLLAENFYSVTVMLDGGADKARMKVVDKIACDGALVEAVKLPDGEDPETVEWHLIKDQMPGQVGRVGVS